MTEHDDPIPGERFLPGRVLAGRYRVVARIGRGGMGEVFRADDLKLGQPVALKFLPQEVSEDPERLAALFAEVRLARQVSHPGVCRVHDIAESDGVHFLSMEFVDGEDLGSLLRRIGHLPANKAVEISRETCAALAAIHGRHLLHRDLKPANLMLDGRGHVRITDFGLAELQDTPSDPEMIVGTPAYMAPECLTGAQPPSVQSDLYSLGLTLYELFTGKRAFEATKFFDMVREREQTTPISPAKHQRDIDPKIEQVILSCLDREPQRRPRSALAVAAALPGGDPISAAIAAGETPSPAAVAAASYRAEGLTAAVAWPCFGLLVAGLIALAAVAPHTQLVPMLSLPEPPQAMAARARELMRNLGFAGPAADRAYGFELDEAVLDEVAAHDRTATRWDRLVETHPNAVMFWYREHTGEMVPSSPRYRASYQDPPLIAAGMVGVELDHLGRLRRLDAPASPMGASTTSEPFDPDALFETAGLRQVDFQSATPATPIVAGDQLLSWVGRAPDEPAHPVRVDAVAFHGRPVSFLVRETTEPHAGAPAADPSGQTTSLMQRTVRPALFLLALLLGAWLARRNLRAGRGDTKRAMRLAIAFLLVRIVSTLLGSHHTAGSATQQLMTALAWGLYDLAYGWLIYVAIEPSVRKLWPRWLVSWARLVDGQHNDPRVGRDLLIGCLVGIGIALAVAAHQAAPAWLGAPPGRPDNVGYVENQLTALLGLAPQFADVLSLARSNTVLLMGFIVILVIARLLLRNTIAAFVAALVLFTPLALPKGELAALNWALAIVVTAGLLLTILRSGLLATVVALITYAALEASPLGLGVRGWAAPHALFAVVLVAAIGGYGFYRALGGRTAFRGMLAE